MSCTRCANLDHDREHGTNCQFCGNEPGPDRQVFSGPGVRICTWCAELVVEAAKDRTAPSPIEWPTEADAILDGYLNP